MYYHKSSIYWVVHPESINHKNVKKPALHCSGPFQPGVDRVATWDYESTRRCLPRIRFLVNKIETLSKGSHLHQNASCHVFKVRLSSSLIISFMYCNPVSWGRETSHSCPNPSQQSCLYPSTSTKRPNQAFLHSNHSYFQHTETHTPVPQ